MFRKEANLTDISLDDAQQSDSDVTSVLSVYKSEGDPAQYEKAYSELKKFVESALDIYKVRPKLSLTSYEQIYCVNLDIQFYGTYFMLCKIMIYILIVMTARVGNYIVPSFGTHVFGIGL